MMNLRLLARLGKQTSCTGYTGNMHIANHVVLTIKLALKGMGGTTDRLPGLAIKVYIVVKHDSLTGKV